MRMPRAMPDKREALGGSESERSSQRSRADQLMKVPIDSESQEWDPKGEEVWEKSMSHLQRQRRRHCGFHERRGGGGENSSCWALGVCFLHRKSK